MLCGACVSSLRDNESLAEQSVPICSLGVGQMPHLKVPVALPAEK